VIYNGVSVASAARSSLPADTLRLLYLGRIVPWKGCHSLLSILSLIRKEYGSVSVKLDLIGDTAYWPLRYRHDLAAKIEELHLSPFCRILPHVEDPSHVFSNYHVFCNASFQEPFGRAIAEAQGNGLPVVSYDSGGVGEIVTDNETGFLVPDGNEGLFVEALGRFVVKPGLIHEMGEKGRKRVAAFFNRAIQAPLLCDFLQELIALRQTTQD
jgi:spore coat protein SA